jgi:hypothetical protein
MLTIGGDAAGHLVPNSSGPLRPMSPALEIGPPSTLGSGRWDLAGDRCAPDSATCYGDSCAGRIPPLSSSESAPSRPAQNTFIFSASAFPASIRCCKTTWLFASPFETK